MANNIIRRVWNQNRMVNIEDLTGAAFQAESGGHTFEISGIDDTGAAVPLSGTVAGVFRRPDNADIALTGSASDGVVSVTLSEDCYAVPGRFGLTIFVTSNSQKVAVYACVGTVAVSSTGNVAGDTPASVEDLLDAIDAAIADLNSAIGQIPASYANVMAAIAPTYSGSALYSVGSYAWYNGSLYRCTTAITTAEAWTAAHWTAAALGDDVTYKTDTLHEIFNEYGMNNRYDIGIISNAKISEAAGKGVTITQLSSTSFMLNGTATAGFNINLFRTRNVGGTDYFSVKCSDQTVDDSDIGMTLGYFNQEDTAVGYLTAVGINQAPKKVEYPSAAVKNRDYFAIQNGGSFANAVFYICASPTQATTFDEKILQNTQSINDEKTSFAYSFAPIIVGKSSYLEYDTTKETLTIPQDIIYLGNKVDGNTIYKILNRDAPVVIQNVNYSFASTTALKLVLDTEEWEFRLLAYGTGNLKKNKLVAAIRLQSSSYPGAITTPLPWKIDGNPYGIPENNIDPNSIVKTAAHRGWYTEPENTIVSFKTARKIGCIYGETDIQFTSDNVPVLLHDDTINRTCCNASDGSALGDAPIYITSLTYDNGNGTLYNYDACKPAQWADYHGTKIPTLDQFCKFCRSVGMKPYIELKANANLTEQKIKAIIDVVNKNGLGKDATYTSFVSSYLETVKSYMPSARIGFIVQDSITSQTITTAQNLKNGSNEVFIDSNALSDSECSLCYEAGIPLEGWDIESLVGIRNANPYITGFTMNHFIAGNVLYEYAMKNM